MPVSPKTYKPDARFMALGPEFSDPVKPADFPETILRFRNQRHASTVGLDTLDDDEWRQTFGRFPALPNNQPSPLAMRYHGHQFRTYNPDLGDGRGFLFAQLRDVGGRLLDLGTKGSGQTPWSRTADGRLTLKGGVREVLATAMLEGQGTPTSKSFSLIETGEPLMRGDEPSPTRSAVLTRLSHSHIRFGTFQRLAYFERTDLLSQLIDHVCETYYPETAQSEQRAVDLLEAVTARTARLTASWMAAGFVHGVLNTDNMNINGESFDYGPYRFLPKNDPNFVAAYFDQTGLYAFGRQPQAVFWNLQQLAGCFAAIAEQTALVEVLKGFASLYQAELVAAMLRRLGILPEGEQTDGDLVNAAFSALAEGGVTLRWEPFFFDWFGGPASEDRAMAGPRRALYEGEAFTAFRRKLQGRSPDRPERLSTRYFQSDEPQELLYDEIEEIWSTIAVQDDWRPFNAKLAALEDRTQSLEPDLAPEPSR